MLPDRRKLMVFDIAARKWSELASGTFNNPVSSKDGEYVYYQSYDVMEPDCWI